MHYILAYHCQVQQLRRRLLRGLDDSHAACNQHAKRPYRECMSELKDTIALPYFQISQRSSLRRDQVSRNTSKESKNLITCFDWQQSSSGLEKPLQ